MLLVMIIVFIFDLALTIVLIVTRLVYEEYDFLAFLCPNLSKLIKYKHAPWVFYYYLQENMFLKNNKEKSQKYDCFKHKSKSSRSYYNI